MAAVLVDILACQDARCSQPALHLHARTHTTPAHMPSSPRPCLHSTARNQADAFIAFTRGHELATRTLKSLLAAGPLAAFLSKIGMDGPSLQSALQAPLYHITLLWHALDLLHSAAPPGTSTKASLAAASSAYADMLRAAGGVPRAIRDAVVKACDAIPVAPTGTGTLAGQVSQAPASPVAMQLAPEPTLHGAGFSPQHTAQSLVQRLGSPSRAQPPAPPGAPADVPADVQAVARAQAEVAMADAALSEVDAIVAAHAAQAAAAASGPGGGDALVPRDDDAGTVERALAALDAEERELYTRLSQTGVRPVFEAFMTRKRELTEEEGRLLTAIEEHEEVLASVRERLAAPPAAVLPADPTKASLYVAWKRALADREQVLRDARRRKRALLRDLKSRHEAQIVLLEMERRATLDGLRKSVENERSKVAAAEAELAQLDDSIATANSALSAFKEEFEQLRVALVVDRMAKSGQLESLAARRKTLLEQAETLAVEVSATRERVSKEEAEKWEAKVAEARAAADAAVSEEKATLDSKLDSMKAALAAKYEAGFAPLLAEAEAKHVQALERVATLQRELAGAESELATAHSQARTLSSQLAEAGDNGSVALVRHEADKVPAAAAQPAVDRKTMAEFEALKRTVVSMWETLPIPPEDIAAFLSEAELMAPFSPGVLELYREMHAKLSAALEDIATAEDTEMTTQRLAASHTLANASPQNKAANKREPSRASPGSSRPGQPSRASPQQPARRAAPSPMSGMSSAAKSRVAGGGSGSSARPGSHGSPTAARAGQRVPAVSPTRPSYGSRTPGSTARSSTQRGTPARSPTSMEEAMSSEMARRAVEHLPPSVGGRGARREKVDVGVAHASKRAEQLPRRQSYIAGRMSWQ